MPRFPVFATIMLVFVFAVACGGDEDSELVIMTHDSFDISEAVIQQFELENDATVVIQKAGDAGEALVRAILEKGNPSADLLYGVDNTPADGISDANQYVTFPNVPNLPDVDQIVAVRISVTANSVDAVSDAGDGILRRTFTQTILVRNANPAA